ncbi:MAG: universal stress protein, partial [Anaerolineae bacterium]|nr:universal stress protein [Anaerolineae bacterium]
VRGRLRIFLGYAIGVGKTHTMLQAGHQRQQEGVDVVCGAINTRDFEASQTLVSQIETIPSQTVFTGNTTNQGLDLHAILARQPDLALIDDLEQVNSLSSHHPYRYQDVEELLDSGIDVYTTVNIQYLESLNDIVKEITGITIERTVPDRLFDTAEQIELVDILPEDLLKRFQHGQTQFPDGALPDMQQLYRLGNLRALRELALRQTAKHVDHQMRTYMTTKAIPGPWAAGERLLVCISSNPLSTRLVRTGYRLARELNAEWFVVYVDEPSGTELFKAHKRQLYDTMKLAERMGAQVDRITGSSISEALLDFAHQQNITKIIIGQPLRSRWQEILSGSVVDQLIRHSGTID